MKIKSANSFNRQLTLNILSGVVVFCLNLCITFFLTPYIVRKLGTSAYGFIGLTNTIIGYSGLITIAVNSMAGRFITIQIHKGNLQKANEYLSSVFFTNLFISIVIFVAIIISDFYLEHLINIPPDLVQDVKCLYLLLGVSTCLGIMTGVISVGAFIRNRLDITNTRDIIGSTFRSVSLLLLFGFFIPKLWYFGVVNLLVNIYLITSNWWFFRLLVPELRVSKKSFHLRRIAEIAGAGAWNIINKISNMLTRGCELLLSNLYVSAKAMGQLSLAITVPGLILSFFGMICHNFSPELTRLYAQNDIEGLKGLLLKSIRISGFAAAIPLSICYALGDIFFKCWLPDSDYNLLYILSILGSIELIVGLPIEPLWNIFVVTNHVKQSSLYQLGLAIVTFAVIIASMYIFNDVTTRLMMIAGIHSALCIYRNLTFLPKYGAKCIGVKINTFYPTIFKSVSCTMIISIIGLLIKYLSVSVNFFDGKSWSLLFFDASLLAVIAVVLSFYIILKKQERKDMIVALKSKLRI